MTRDAGFKRRVRARAARTGEAYTTARARLDRAGPAPAAGRVLHVTTGDSVVGTLREAGVLAPIVAWRDVLHEGPVPAGLAPAALRRARAAHLAGDTPGRAAAIERSLAARDRLLEAHADGEYVLWFEADLYDQLQLAQVLDALGRLAVDPARVALVSIGEHRGIAHFGGLGELDAGQLAALAEQAEPLTPEALRLAAAAWAAFTAPDPDGLPAIARARSRELRFLGEAFGRLLGEYPSRSDGLSLTQRRLLLAAAGGAATAGDVFLRVQEAERRPFLGDETCFRLLRTLAGGPAALLEIEGSGARFAGNRVRLTARGEAVLAGREDHVRLAGIDRWIGGVHLAGHAVRWRYDERLETLVAG
jgi:hypothetical protein